MILATKYLDVDWGAYSFTDRHGKHRHRPWRFRHNRRVHNIYLQIGPLEVSVWYR